MWPSITWGRMLVVHEEVRAALDEGRPVVALESTIIAHGLPRPDNLRVAREVEAAVREHGAVPATIALAGGAVRIGLDAEALEALAGSDGVVKCGVRDLAPVLARGAMGATTVAATSHLAALAGIRVFATGGIGGVHRGARDTFDESADLETLGRVGICVVAAGVKSILDIPATLERLETLNVTVLGYRTDTFPAFYLTDSGLPVPWRVDSPAEIAEVLRQRDALGVPGGVLVANPLDEQVDPEMHDRVLREGLQAAAAAGIGGRDVTPFLLERFHAQTGGESLRANVRLVLRNAALAAEIAAA
jgi:pseudouridine-5'-phosphate glycosidase